MIERVEVAIIGAGSAGLAALTEVRKATNGFSVAFYLFLTDIA